jgi:hypothetical protein
MRKAYHALRGLVKGIKRAFAATAVTVRPLSRFAREHDPSASRGTRRLIPTSSAGGGLMPGIDISNSAALQQMDDLEYVHRMERLS